MVSSTRQARAPPKCCESVMQFDVPDGVVNATSSPSCVVVPSRVAAWNWFTPAGCPDSTNAITSATAAPGCGAPGGIVDVGVAVRGVEVLPDGDGGEGAVCPA